jgi:KDO2-lipid IV(A) lauroyltransferase
MLRRHLRRALGPNASDDEVARQVRRAFRSYAAYWLESFRLATMTRDELEARMSWEGMKLVDDALAGGKGVILALPHLGGWDFGGAWLAAVGYAPTVVVEAVEPPALFDWFVALRRSLGMTVVAHGPQATAGVLGALRRNQLVGLLSDRDLARTGIDVEFFGERTTLPAGPATLAIRSGAPLLPCAIYFDGRGAGHHGIVRPAIDVTRHGSLREDVTRITQDLAGELEGLIRRAPDQWHLMQPNWPSDFGEETPG